MLKKTLQKKHKFETKKRYVEQQNDLKKYLIVSLLCMNMFDFDVVRLCQRCAKL